MELKGLTGLSAYLAYLKFAWYIPMSSLFRNIEDKNEALEQYHQLDDDQKRSVIVEVMGIAPLDNDDALKLLSAHKDKNGIPYGVNNIKNLKPNESFDLLSETLIYCGNCDSRLFFYPSSNKESSQDKKSQS